ncbi:MAG: hypothetical protein Q9225_002447 [Loekoesia sp. 1 TL-2023]
MAPLNSTITSSLTDSNSAEDARSFPVVPSPIEKYFFGALVLLVVITLAIDIFEHHRDCRQRSTHGRGTSSAAAGILILDQKGLFGAKNVNGPFDQHQITKARYQFEGNTGAAKDDEQKGHLNDHNSEKKTQYELGNHVSDTRSNDCMTPNISGSDISNDHEGKGRDDGGCKGLREAFAAWLAGAERAVNQ